LIAASFVGFAHGSKGKRSPKWSPFLVGIVHFLAQMTIAFAITVLVLAILKPLNASLLTYVVLIPVLTIGLSWPICGMIFSLYFWIANIAFGLHEQEVYSAQSIEDWKSFLRFRVGPEGLTIYPIGLRNVARSWHQSPDPQGIKTAAEPAATGLLQRAMIMLGVKPVTIEVRNGAPNLLRPATPLQPHLIEKPITIKAKGTAV
jgi:hypothetical protein